MPATRRIEGVSAVVCNHDGEGYIADCLASVLGQENVAPGFLDEVIVVDDASQDGSVALIRERFPSVRVIELPENRGPCAARNAGMLAAKNRFCLAIDNDAVLRPDVLARLARALEDEPGYAVAMTRNVVHSDPDVIHYDSGAFHYVGLLSLRNFYTPLAQATGAGVVETDALIGICCLVDKQVVLAAGGYDEDFFYLAEDYELAYRLRLLGERLCSVEEAICLHKGGTAGLSFRGGSYPEKRAYLHARNRLYVLLKCYRWRTLLVALPGILFYELVWLAFTLRAGHLRAGLAGKAAALVRLGALLRKRRKLQPRRVVPDRELLVGGPLTFSPSLVASGPKRFAVRVIDALLRAWWVVARPLAG